MKARTLILLSDSNDKCSGGREFNHWVRHCFPDFLSRESRIQLLAKRAKVLGMLKGGPPKLYNEDQRGGFRDLRQCNRNLRKGPDFGGDGGEIPSRGFYRPAYHRYSGRFFISLQDESRNFWDNLRGKNGEIEILFVSALYGLLFWDEPIQQYDCYIADYTQDKSRRKLAEFWSETLTDVLADFLEQSGHNSSPINCVYDLLSPEAYQTIFHWEKIQATKRHRIFKGVPPRDVLPHIAKIVSNHFDNFFKGSRGFNCDQWYSVPGEENPTIQFGFESHVGDNKQAWREEDWNEVRQRLQKEHPKLSTFYPEVFDHLVRTECIWQQVKMQKQADFGSVVVSYAKPVEAFFKNHCWPQTGDDRRTLWKFLGKLEKNWPDLKADVQELADLRDRGAHTKPPPCQRDDAKRARLLVSENILPRGLDIVKSQEPKR